MMSFVDPTPEYRARYENELAKLEDRMARTRGPFKAARFRLNKRWLHWRVFRGAQQDSMW